ncbi:MAG: transposase family protein [Gammaproteobacteria bacterium]|nr:transposase family protein [Gammaproteobacteria bacterium]
MPNKCTRCLAVLPRIPDPRRAHGRRHRLPVVLALAAGASLCGMRGYKAMADWAKGLGQGARSRFGCRRTRVNGKVHSEVPSEYVIRDCLVRIEPGALEWALDAWNQAWAAKEEALAIDGKTMKNAINEVGEQTHIMSVVGHESGHCYTQKSRLAAGNGKRRAQTDQ